MCIGGRSQPIQQAPTYRDAPPIVTGSQTGVENPKDTKKATEDLKIKRQKREGTYVDANLSMLEDSFASLSKVDLALCSCAYLPPAVCPCVEYSIYRLDFFALLAAAIF